MTEAAAELEAAVRLSGDNPAALASLGYVHGRRGRLEAARGVLETLDRLGGSRYVSPVNKALVRLALGEPDAALEELELGYRQRSRSMIWVNVDRRFDSLRRDERFQDLLARIGFDPAVAD